MDRMERIGWWFLRHSKPQKTYFFVCPECGTLNPSTVSKCQKCKIKYIFKTDVDLDEIDIKEKGETFCFM